MKFHLNKTKDFYCLKKKKQKKMFKFCTVRKNTKKKNADIEKYDITERKKI